MKYQEWRNRLVVEQNYAYTAKNLIKQNHIRQEIDFLEKNVRYNNWEKYDFGEFKESMLLKAVFPRNGSKIQKLWTKWILRLTFLQKNYIRGVVCKKADQPSF